MRKVDVARLRSVGSTCFASLPSATMLESSSNSRSSSAPAVSPVLRLSNANCVIPARDNTFSSSSFMGCAFHWPNVPAQARRAKAPNLVESTQPALPAAGLFGDHAVHCRKARSRPSTPGAGVHVATSNDDSRITHKREKAEQNAATTANMLQTSLAPIISAELPDRIIPTTSGVRDGPSMIASETVVVTAMRHELNTTSEMINRIMCAMLPNGKMTYEDGAIAKSSLGPSPC